MNPAEILIPASSQQTVNCVPAGFLFAKLGISMGQGAARTAAEAAAIDDALPALPEALAALRVAITLFEKQQSDIDRLKRKLDETEAVSGTAKAALLRLMGHELKSPLNAIIGFAELMQTSAGSSRTNKSPNMPG